MRSPPSLRGGAPASADERIEHGSSEDPVHGGMSWWTDTKERQQTVDVGTYFHAVASFYVKDSGAQTINALAARCGHSVGVERGTTQAGDAPSQSEKCKSAGKSGVKLSVY